MSLLLAGYGSDSTVGWVLDCWTGCLEVLRHMRVVYGLIADCFVGGLACWLVMVYFALSVNVVEFWWVGWCCCVSAGVFKPTAGGV